MKKEPIILIGGGGHCHSVIDVIEQQGRYEIIGIVDIPERIGEKVLNYEIIGHDGQLVDLIPKYKNVHISLGYIKTPALRIRLFDQAKQLSARFPVLISPLAHISSYATLLDGTIVMHQALVNAGVHIGQNCIVNTKALIEHDAIIGDHCHISTGAIVNGGVRLGKRVFYGSGAVSKEYINIPDDSFIKANSLVK